MQSDPQHKRTISLPSLPPEVWICIFHIATDVPGTLIPDIYAHASLIGHVYIERYHADRREALTTKRTLVLVCRQWWHLATPYLYRSVCIGQARYLSSLSRTLADSATGKGTIVGTRPLGEYTQRLDIAIRGSHLDSPDAESGLFTTIIKHMPHLAIAVFAPITWYTDCRYISDNILDALHHSAPSLRVLDWSATPVKPSNRRLMDLLAKCTQLRILHYPDLIWSRELERDGIPATVTTLRTQCTPPTHAHDQPLENSDLNIAHRFRCPTLRELVLDIFPLFTQWADLLRAYGPQLVSVHLYILGVDIEPPLELLAEISPGLRRLTITSKLDSVQIRPTSVFPSVTYLGLNPTWSRSLDQKFKRFFVALEQLRSRMPSLRVVQLLNESNVKCLLDSHPRLAVRVLRPFMEDASLRIEDRDGVLLTDRLRALGHL